MANLITIKLLLPLCLAVNILAQHPCLPIFKVDNIGKGCCEVLNAKFDFLNVNTTHGRVEGYTCEMSLEPLSELGVLDGKVINNQKLDEALAMLGTTHPDAEAMYQRVRDECVAGEKYLLFPPRGHDCPSMQFHMCGYTNALIECPKWKSGDNCAVLQETTKQCKSDYENLLPIFDKTYKP